MTSSIKKITKALGVRELFPKIKIWWVNKYLKIGIEIGIAKSSSEICFNYSRHLVLYTSESYSLRFHCYLLIAWHFLHYFVSLMWIEKKSITPLVSAASRVLFQREVASVNMWERSRGERTVLCQIREWYDSKHYICLISANPVKRTQLQCSRYIAFFLITSFGLSYLLECATKVFLRLPLAVLFQGTY